MDVADAASWLDAVERPIVQRSLTQHHQYNALSFFQRLSTIDKVLKNHKQDRESNYVLKCFSRLLGVT